MRMADVKEGDRIDAMRTVTWDEDGRRRVTYRRSGTVTAVEHFEASNPWGKTWPSVTIRFADGATVTGGAGETVRRASC